MRVLGHALAGAAALAAAPIGAATLALRPRWRVGLAERLGLQADVPQGSIWIHAASVGEVLAASRLVEKLRSAGHAVCASTWTVTGRDLMRSRWPDVPCHLAPLDHPWCVEAALSRVAPAVLVLVETELWPSWIAAACRRGVPVVLVSGRLSDRSFPRYRAFERVVAPMLRRLTAVGARTEADGARFLALGAPSERIAVTGDLKLEVAEVPPRPTPELEKLVGPRALVVAGSTHPGEEALLLEAFDRVEWAGIDASFVLAPRHPARASEVKRLVKSTGRKVRRRTRGGSSPLARGEVLVLDTMGELASLYGRADAAFVGGSLSPVGGHNVLEPVAAGRPVLFGPETANVRHSVEILEECGAGRSVSNAAELAESLVEWLRDPEGARARGERGREALQRHQGSASRCAELVEAALER